LNLHGIEIQNDSNSHTCSLIHTLSLFSFPLSDDGSSSRVEGWGTPLALAVLRGDVMGCGIMFPRDYILDSGDDRDDGDLEVRPKQRRVQNDLYMNDEDEEEDGEELEGEQEGRNGHGERLSFVYITANLQTGPEH
ncbi:hypothetical protein J4Q44_G00082320, partial [Coregonus suidteri]